MNYEIHIEVGIWEADPEGKPLGWGTMMMGTEDFPLNVDDSEMFLWLAGDALDRAVDKMRELDKEN